LVRNALPEIIGLLEPDDVKELALEEDVSARLIRQKIKIQMNGMSNLSP
jgi:50S ribosomal protein L16 3-hydroxylase